MSCEVCGCKLKPKEENEGICRKCQSILSMIIDDSIDEMMAS